MLDTHIPMSAINLPDTRPVEEQQLEVIDEYLDNEHILNVVMAPSALEEEKQPPAESSLANIPQELTLEQLAIRRY